MLQVERSKQGLSVSDTAQRMGLEASELQRLEEDPNAHPTMETVQRLAHALGKQLRVELIDDAA